MRVGRSQEGIVSGIEKPVRLSARGFASVWKWKWRGWVTLTLRLKFGVERRWIETVDEGSGGPGLKWKSK
jgi:hypothetical protein